MICTPHPVLFGWPNRKNEMGRSCGTNGGRRSACRVLVGKAVGEISLEVPGVDRRIILRHMFRHSGSPRPKYSECKNPLEKFSPPFFGIQTASSHWLSPRLSKRSITHLCLCNWRTFEGNTSREGLQGGSCSCTTVPRLTRHLQPRRNWHTWAGFQCLDHPPYSPALAPSDCQLFSGLKNNWKIVIFRPTRRSLLPRTAGWRTTFWIVLVTCKSYSNGLRSVLSFVDSMLNKSRSRSL